jgi:cation diffusion facilitator family transporter
VTEASITRMTREKRRVALTSVFAAVFLTGLKLIVGLLTRSLGILAEALHSGLDLLAALVTFVAVRAADRPADADHHYGHDKIESLSALVESGLLFFTSGWVIYEAVRRIVSRGPEVSVNFYSIGVMVISIVIDFGRSRALSRAAKKYSSQALEADALHFSTDIFSSLVVIVGLVLVKLGFKLGDPLVALGVSVFVTLSAVRLTIRAVHVLMDRAQQSDVKFVQEAIAAVRDLDSYSRLRIRRGGHKTFVDLTIRVDDNLPLAQAHEVTELLEREIARRIAYSDVVVHIEPSGFGGSIMVQTEEGRINRPDILDQISRILNEHMAQFVSYHDVEADTAGHEPTITFHLVMPEEAKVKDTHDFCDHLEQDIKRRFTSARVSIHVEPCDRNCEPCQVVCEHRRARS